MDTFGQICEPNVNRPKIHAHPKFRSTNKFMRPDRPFVTEVASNGFLLKFAQVQFKKFFEIN
jgi:hypothetical protein